MAKAKLILLVEDDLFIRELYQRVLEKSGYRVITAQDGEECLRAIYHNPDLVLLDIMLPKINGLEVLKRIREDDLVANIPIILLTNLGQEDIMEKASKLDISSYLIKMRIAPNDLVKHIDAFFKNPSLKDNFSKLYSKKD